ncbi:putative transporter [Zalerion maritima]|uniref:Transporter n=1 Tax=Zalerion maritima TaxID=339359 RepID=A0AAD5RPA8_9PEZI|nr:putative transporter [Zalerion maritima]
MTADMETLSPTNSPSKEKITQDLETGSVAGLPSDFPDPDAGLSPEERAEADRKLVRKLDWKLIPWLCWLYLLSFLDRTNIGNAKISGLEEDLDLDATKFNASLTIFFASYAICEPLTNVLLKKFRPSVFIPIIMILWGVSLTSMGFVKSWASLMVTRFLLGVTEAGLFPGVTYYFSCWYLRSELGIRMAIFFSAAAIAGSFGGCLAAAISRMDGLGNLAGWSWIFVLEGLLTIVFGVISFWMIQDFPVDSKFLSHDDKARVLRRLTVDKQHSAHHEEFKWEYLWQSLKDWKMWLGMVIFGGVDMPLYAFAIFLPSIIDELGFRSNEEEGTVFVSQLMTVPPYVAGAIATVLVGWIADKYRSRGILNIVCSAIAIVGFILFLVTDDVRARYTGTFLAAIGIYPCVPNTVSWTANNIEGVYKRGIVLGFVVGWGNMNGVASSNVYSGDFRTGHIACLSFLCLLFFASIIQTLCLANENKRRQRGDRDHWVEDKSPEEIRLLGDKRPDFLYTI